MEFLTFFAVLFLLFFALKGIGASQKEDREKWILTEKMPKELSNAKLVVSEKYFSTVKPRKIHGAVDQLYKVANGFHVILDSKTRSRKVVYKKDIVQLSVYKVLLESNGYKVHPYAYFRVVTPDGVEYIKKELLTEAETIAEYDNARLVVSGKKKPLTAERKAMCRGCGQQQNCQEWNYKEKK